jgi:transcriptional repressor NrdR
MRCPWCGHDDDKVIDSRPADGGETIRRRRQCLSCKRRYTTFERVEELGLTVVKRNGTFEPYDRTKVLAGISKAVANRPVTDEQVAAVVARIEDRLRRRGPRVTSERVGVEILGQLARLDEVAYLRFASVYKDFQAPSDFARELGMLRKKSAKTRTP